LKKMLIIDPEKCTGCRLCVLVCSFKHERKFSYMFSRIQIRSDEIINVHTPFVCEHCGEHPCVDACPVEAIYYDEHLTIFRVDREKCIGCGKCVEACPYNGIFIDKEGKAIKCDLCEGDPACVKACIFPKAIQYVDVTPDNVFTKHETMLTKLKYLRGEHYASVR